MFEGVVANLLNKYLGKYIQNLDSDNLNVGIYQGCVELTDLQLKPEALFELDLPVEVKAGYVGKISVTIPWTSLYSLPVKVNIEDVYVLAGPIVDRSYDARKEAALNNAVKRARIAELEKSRAADEEETTPEDQGFLEKLTATIINNIQVSIQSIHFRYEDKITNPDHPCACGIMLKSLSAETTNGQWLPTHVHDSTATQINKLVNLQALSAYWNPNLPENCMVRTKLHTTAWRSLLKNSLDTHLIMDQEFDFKKGRDLRSLALRTVEEKLTYNIVKYQVLRPVTSKAKLLFNKDVTSSQPHMVADLGMDEINVMVSRQQFLNILSLTDSFKMMSVNQRYRKFSPGVPLHSNVSKWWKYAYTAVVEERIRPYAWNRIKAHRQIYRRYKDVYKKKLQHPDNENIRTQSEQLEEQLNLANIVMARCQAKMELEKEAPERVEHKPVQEQGWLGWLWGSKVAVVDEPDEIVVIQPKHEPSWLRKLSPEEKKKLYSAIGYNGQVMVQHNDEYVSHRINISLKNCSLSLINYSKEVLKITVTHMTAGLDHRPNNKGYKVSTKTESFVVEGVSIEHDLVPLITSDIGVYAPSVSQVFRMEFETNPIHVEADLALKLNIQPVEIVYDEHAVTEVIAFFQVPQVTVADVKGVVAAGWGQMVEVSRAGLQYAIEQHKTVHLAVNMRSPYVVIPEYGTLHRGGNVIVIDFGKLKVESELQPKNMSLHECTMSEIESRLYDKFNINITDVKVLLSDSGDDWHTAQTQADSEFHILPSVGMQLSFFNTVKADYKQLPQQKLEAKLSVLKLHLSDEKIQMIADFFKHIPMPHSNSMMGLDDSVDGHIEPHLYSRVLDQASVQQEPTIMDLRRMRRSVRLNSVMERPKAQVLSARNSRISTDSEYYYSASDHSDEDIDEWSKALDIPSLDDHSSSSNMISMLLRFSLGEVVVQVAKSMDKNETPYLMIRVDRLCVESALTTYGLVLQAGLGGVSVVDKIHTGTSGEYLEMISSGDDRDLISVVYRKVSPECPDFEAVYRMVEQGLMIQFSSLKVTFDRAAALHLNQFVQGLMIGINTNTDVEMKRSTSTILGSMHPQPQQQQQQPDNVSFAQSMFLTPGEDDAPLGATKLHLVMKLDEVDILMVNHETEFAEVIVRGLESKVLVKATRTIVQAKLNDMIIEDLTENTLYPRILTIEDDKVFDFKFVSYHKPPLKHSQQAQQQGQLIVDHSLRLRVGRVSGVYLYKFMTEMTSFIEPFISPNTYEVYKVAAQTVVHDTENDNSPSARPSRPIIRQPVRRSKTSVADVGRPQGRLRRSGVVGEPPPVGSTHDRRKTTFAPSSSSYAANGLPPPHPNLHRGRPKRKSVIDRTFNRLSSIVEKAEKPEAGLRRTGEVVNTGFVELRRKTTRVRQGVERIQRKSVAAQGAFNAVQMREAKLRRRLSVHDRMSNLFNQLKSSSLQAIQQGIQDVQEQGTRVSLYVDIRAPTVQVPQHSESTNVLLLKLGDLTLRNSFETSDIGAGVLQHWDHMILKLDSVQVIRCVSRRSLIRAYQKTRETHTGFRDLEEGGKLSMNAHIDQVHTIVEPISLGLDIKRSLPPMHTDLGYDITGKLHIVKMAVTQQDLKVIMSVLRENHTEQSVHLEKVDVEDLMPLLPDKLTSRHSGLADLAPVTPVVEIEQPLLAAPEVADLARQTRFNVALEGMTLTLLGEEEDPLAVGRPHVLHYKYCAAVDRDSRPVSPVRDELDELSRFEIGRIDIDGLLKDDSSLEVKVKLLSVSMDDIREHSNLAVKRLIMSSLVPTGKGPVPATATDPMVVFEYKLSKEGNQHINLQMETMRINVCVPYLLMVWHFFADSMLAPSHNPPDAQKPGHVSPASATVTRNEAAGTDIEDNTALMGTTLTVSGKFKQPEIVLFAEPTERHSRVLLLKTNASFDYFSHGERQRMDAKVKQLQIISCLYNANQTASMVLYPCDLEFTQAVESSTSGVVMDAHITDIYMNLSATTLSIIQNVYDVINHDGQRTESVDGDFPPPVYHNLWQTNAIKPDKWLEADQEDAMMAKYPLIPTSPPSETLNMSMEKIQIMFEIENQDYPVPRLCLKSGIKASVQDWSVQMRCEASIKLEMIYFNEKLATWEPLLEPVMVAEDNYNPWEVLIKTVDAYSHPISCGDGDFQLDKQNELDGEVHYLMSKVRADGDSSETETDSESEMTVIKPKLNRKMRLGSNQSYDSAGRPGSVQGESDSEPEGLMNTLSSNLDSIFSSDSSEDEDPSDDEIFEDRDKPVFMTAKGPVHVTRTGGHLLEDAFGASILSTSHYRQSGQDEVDGAVEGEEQPPLCRYVVIDSRDDLHINLTLQAMELITEVTEALTRSTNMTLKSVHDLPGFEMHNELEIQAKLTLHQDLAVREENLHNITLLSRPPRTSRLVDSNLLEDMDEMDGLAYLTQSAGAFGPMLLSIGAFAFDETEDDVDHRKSLTKDKLNVKIDGFDELFGLSHKKATTKLVSLAPCRNDTNYCMVYNVDVEHGRKKITLRSPLQVHNHLTVPVEIYCRTEELQKVGPIPASAKVNGPHTLLKVVDTDRVYNIPLFVAYHCKIFVAPAQIGYEKAANGIWWQDLSMAKDRSRLYTCQPMDPNHNPLHFKALCEEGKGLKGVGHAAKLVPHYTIHLHPPVLIHNLLPYDIHYSLEEEQEDQHYIINGHARSPPQGSPASSLTHGENAPLYTADLNKAPRLKIQLHDYLGIDWTGMVELSTALDEFKAITMDAESNIEGQNKQLSLGVHVNLKNSMDLYVYSPYWLINKTGLPLQMRGSRSEAVYENDISSDPLLFRFKKHRRKKAKLRVYNAKWTRSFSMDTVGSNGVIICNDKERSRKYQFLVEITLSRLKLTKIVTIMPYFLVVNNTPHSLRYMEENEQADLWMNINANDVSPFWPATDSMRMYIKYQDSNVSSQHFSLQKSHHTVLRMDRGTGLVVEVSGGMETPVTVSFLPYEDGTAPVRVENLCEDVFMKLHQKNQSQVSLLAPNQSVLYTWDDPTSERTLMWNVYNRKKPSYPAFISTDGYGEEQLSIQTVRRSSVLISNDKEKKDKEKDRGPNAHGESSDDDSDEEIVVPPTPRAPLLRSLSKPDKDKDRPVTTRTDKVIVYWVSYLDGLQRVLLFTQDERIARRARKANEAERATWAVFISLSGLSMSLVNALQEELAYMTLSCAAAMWEVEVKHKWKSLNMELASWLEQRWRENESDIRLEDFLEANLDRMEMKKPWMGALRRNYQPALWIQYRQSAHHMFLHTRIHHLQIDNQLNDAYFPTVLHPTPVPSYIVKKSGPKPFIELSLMRRQVPENNIDTIKYCKLLIQEFSLKLDKGFILSVSDIFSTQQPDREYTQLQQDLSVVHRTMRDLTDVQAATRQQRIVFECLHLSPMKMHISFSLDGTVHAVQQQSTSFPSDLVQFFLNSVGATLTEIKEVELRMAYFERRGAVLTWPQLMSQVQHHYMSQAVQQAYVLLLGLDVLGNPYGLVRDFTQGLGDFFYEPFLGSMQSPDKFTDNLVLGVRSLLGHTVGGLAGSVSLVTGSLGKALAGLSFDQDYRRKRHQQMLQQPRHLPQSLYMAGKGFVMGVAVGLSGVVVNPVRGAYEEGTEGFFKGVGKGLLGLITKPTGGAVDMVSMAFDGIRRAAEMGDDVVVRMRPPRYIHPEKGLKPYSRYQAIGMRMLNSLNKGRYADTDIYLAHAALSREDKADVAMLTNKRILLLEKQRFWGDWDVVWETPVEDILMIPQVTPGKLILKVKRDDTGFSLYTSDERELLCTEEEVLQWLQKKVEQAMLARQG